MAVRRLMTESRVCKKGTNNSVRTCMVSVDVEEDLADVQHDSAGSRTFRGVEKIDRILEVFDEFGIKASLFTTGEVIHRYPRLVEKWSTKHEIACHGYYHEPLHKLSILQREEQLEDCCKMHMAVLGGTPKGFRAVMHTIDSAQLRLLEKVGFIYDSSVVPSYIPFRKYIGYKGKAPTEPYHPSYDNYRERGAQSILEIPNSPLVFGIPLTGTWVRVLGPTLYRALLAVRKPAFVSLAMHPWDAVEYKGSFSRGSGETFIGYLESVLKMLARDYRFMCAEDVVSSPHLNRRVSG
jgi:peptidoglycan/xylan/chitin deacetylase (PgdA/CDA1 family)